MNNILDLESFKESRLAKRSPFYSDILRVIRALRKDTLEDGEEFNAESQQRLSFFCSKLDSGFSMPHLGVVYEGSLSLDWQKFESEHKMTMLTLIFAPKNIIFAMRENGVPKANGALNFSYQSLDIYVTMFNSFLEKHFMEDLQDNVQNVRR